MGGINEIPALLEAAGQIVMFSVALEGVKDSDTFYKKYFSKCFGELSVSGFGDFVFCCC